MPRGASFFIVLGDAAAVGVDIHYVAHMEDDDGRSGECIYGAGRSRR